MRPKDITKALEFGLKNKYPILIKGAPGIGKSDIVAQACEKLNVDLRIAHPVVSDPTDFKGLPFPVQNKNGKTEAAEFLPFGDLNVLIHADRPTVYFLDDLGQAPASVQAACMQLILARRINGHHVSPHVVFMAATNRRSDKAGVMGILEPVKSRFHSILELEVDHEDWQEWALTHDMPIELIAFMQWQPQYLSDYNGKASSENMENTACPRTIAHVGEMFREGCPVDIRDSMFSGAAGAAFAAGFVGFLELYKELPNIPDIIKDPENAPVFSDPQKKYAIVGALSNAAEKKNFGAIMRYINRIDADFGVFFMKITLKTKPALANTPEFGEWSLKNVSVIL